MRRATDKNSTISELQVAMFVRISLVVHRHLKFLREHANKAMKSVGSQGIDVAPPSSSNSYCKSRDGTPLRTPELSRRVTDNSVASVTSGEGCSRQLLNDQHCLFETADVQFI